MRDSECVDMIKLMEEEIHGMILKGDVQDGLTLH